MGVCTPAYQQLGQVEHDDGNQSHQQAETPSNAWLD